MSGTMETYDECREREIAAYQQHGKYPAERIVRCGEPYVIGDHSWNMRHPDKPEYVEHKGWFRRDSYAVTCKTCGMPLKVTAGLDKT